ncbi:MAG: ribonuclease HII [Prevotellaceae bacterium]|jgi:ribonuclease HII|nr:ribonuclease HII [Prevotellaceae bacterium]
MANLILNFSGFALECGCDEAGRGCLAGAVTAAAVILPADFECAALNDSKLLTEKQRNALRPIIETNALAWAVAFVDNAEIDRINILNASIEAMHRAVAQLAVVPEYLIIDGNRFKQYQKIPHTTIIKGDGKYLSIAAASVLAKTHRDEYMQGLHKEYPQYGWNTNMGYPTKFHRAAIGQFGLTAYHRLTFDWSGEKKKKTVVIKNKEKDKQ